MTDRSSRPPKYRHYRPKDLAVVRIDGQDRYLGRYGSPESREKYARLIAEHLANPNLFPESTSPSNRTTVAELMLAYWTRRVLPYYVKDGKPTSEWDNIRQALRFLRKL